MKQHYPLPLTEQLLLLLRTRDSSDIAAVIDKKRHLPSLLALLFKLPPFSCWLLRGGSCQVEDEGCLEKSLITAALCMGVAPSGAPMMAPCGFLFFHFSQGKDEEEV